MFDWFELGSETTCQVCRLGISSFSSIERRARALRRADALQQKPHLFGASSTFQLRLIVGLCYMRRPHFYLGISALHYFFQLPSCVCSDRSVLGRRYFVDPSFISLSLRSTNERLQFRARSFAPASSGSSLLGMQQSAFLRLFPPFRVSTPSYYDLLDEEFGEGKLQLVSDFVAIIGISLFAK